MAEAIKINVVNNLNELSVWHHFQVDVLRHQNRKKKILI